MTRKTNLLSLLVCSVLLCTACSAIPFDLEDSALSRLFGYEYDPISMEEIAADEDAIQGDVYWSAFGKVYHTDLECPTLNDYDELTMGSVDQAVAANRTRLCSYCAKRDGIEGVRTDDVDVSDYEAEPKADAEVSTVYWAAEGDAYHFDPDCATLADVEELLAGTVDDAAAAEHAVACTVCAVTE